MSNDCCTLLPVLSGIKGGGYVGLFSSKESDGFGLDNPGWVDDGAHHLFELAQSVALKSCGFLSHPGSFSLVDFLNMLQGLVKLVGLQQWIAKTLR